MTSKIEKLAVAQAIYKVVAAQVSTKDKGNLRGQVDAEMLADYEANGNRTRDVRVNGQIVGTLSVKKSKPKPAIAAEVVSHAAVEDLDRFNDWLWRSEPDKLIDYIFANADDFAAWWLDLTGELPDGCEIVHITVPGEPAVPEQVTGTTLKVDEYKVADALKGELTGAVAALLTEGD